MNLWLLSPLMASSVFKVMMDNNQAGSVEAFFTATIDEAIRIHDVPLQRQLTSSINVVLLLHGFRNQGGTGNRMPNL